MNGISLKQKKKETQPKQGTSCDLFMCTTEYLNNVKKRTNSKSTGGGSCSVVSTSAAGSAGDITSILRSSHQFTSHHITRLNEPLWHEGRFPSYTERFPSCFQLHRLKSAGFSRFVPPLRLHSLAYTVQLNRRQVRSGQESAWCRFNPQTKFPVLKGSCGLCPNLFHTPRKNNYIVLPLGTKWVKSLVHIKGGGRGRSRFPGTKHSGGTHA